MKKYLIFLLPFLLMNVEGHDEVITNKIGIDIKGAVKNPGYYELDINSNVYDAIKISGGLESYADTSITNLSKRLNDEDVIIIYTVDEVSEMKSGSTSIKIIEKECICPKIENVSCINSISTNNNKININTASLEELTSLPGIGEAKAKSIISYRNITPFNKIDDILNIKGIGKSIFDKIKENITV